MTDGETLLKKHSPVLVIFPQAPADWSFRNRPGSWRPGKRGWGDYHPCPAEFFLHRVEQRDSPKPWSFSPRSLFGSLIPRFWRKGVATGLEKLRENAASVAPQETEGWELDVAAIPSQDESRAWQQYHEYLSETQHPYGPAVYGRYVEDDSGPSLQYWYLCLYNDFRNNHEGDWEMVTIELSGDGSPLRAGYSIHDGGSVRNWADVAKDEPGGSHPLLYVARGSHAGYFSYNPRGHQVIKLHHSSNPPALLGWAAWALQRLPVGRRWRDFPPADPVASEASEPGHLGVRLQPELKLMPKTEPTADSEWWWMRLRCNWGSMHTRIRGTIGVIGPWAGDEEDLRWRKPIFWMRSVS